MVSPPNQFSSSPTGPTTFGHLDDLERLGMMNDGVGDEVENREMVGEGGGVCGGVCGGSSGSGDVNLFLLVTVVKRDRPDGERVMEEGKEGVGGGEESVECPDEEDDTEQEEEDPEDVGEDKNSCNEI